LENVIMKTLKYERPVTGLVAAAILTFAMSSHLGAQSAAPQSPGPSLPLSMAQAVAMALDANLDLRAEKLNLDIASHSIAIAKASFLPQVQATTGNTSAKSVPFDFTQGTQDITSNAISLSGSVRQETPWHGSSYLLTWTGRRSTQEGGFSGFNPRLGSTLRVDFTQPLLRDFKTDNLRAGVETAERRRAITDIQLQQRVVATEAAVRFAYLNLVGAIEGHKVAQLNLDIVQQSLDQSKSRVKVGQSPQIEIIQYEAQVASTRDGLIRAVAQIATAEDNLRTLILDPARPDFWQVHIVPTDTIQLAPRDINLDQAIATAIANRLDLAVERRSLEITDLNIRVNHNNALPSVDLNASYLAEGTGGTQFTYGAGFPPPVLSESRRSYGSALGDTLLGAYPTWSVGVTVTYPFGKTASEAAYAQSLVVKHQQEIGVKQLEVQIVGQVREAVRLIENSWQRVQAAQTAREATQQQLAAEERRNSVGLSTTLELQVRQRELANARVNELQAMIDYNRALIQLERVQRIQ
jgi:outer membrane protein